MRGNPLSVVQTALLTGPQQGNSLTGNDISGTPSPVASTSPSQTDEFLSGKSLRIAQALIRGTARFGREDTASVPADYTSQGLAPISPVSTGMMAAAPQSVASGGVAVQQRAMESGSDFADMIRQLATLPDAAPIPAQLGSLLARRGFIQSPGLVLVPPASSGGTVQNAVPLPKAPASATTVLATLASPGKAKPEATPHDRHTDSPAVPTEAPVPLPPLPVKPPDAPPAGEARPVPIHLNAAAVAPAAPEAALTVVIHTDDANAAVPSPQVVPVPVASGPVHDIGAADIAPTPTRRNQQTAPVVGAPPDEAAGQGPDEGSATASGTSPNTASPAGTSPPASSGGGTGHHRGGGDSLTDSRTGGTDAPPVDPGLRHAGGAQNFQMQAEAPKNSAGVDPRPTDTHASEAGRQTARQEPPIAEKAPSQPVRSVSLEFTPDGGRDVRVRLSERAGEVHVSVHSTDPSITRGLRDGVTDLAGLLADAGYNAEAWTSGRHQRENPQSQREAAPQRQSGNAGTESFDGILQYPGGAPDLKESL